MPLVEIAIFAGLVCLIAGFVIRGTPGGVLITGGIVLASLASLELTIREHFAGYRSHSSLLAITSAVGTVAVLLVAGLPRVACLAAGVAVGVTAFALARRVFARRSGGVSWRA